MDVEITILSNIFKPFFEDKIRMTLVASFESRVQKDWSNKLLNVN